jgi:hypothetical protein
MGDEKAAVPKETSEGKGKWSLLRFIGNAHPAFLKAFKETESLSQLAALSIVIAAFSSDQPAARQFAIVAGAMFLMAFVFSTSVVLGAKELFLELFSYVLTGLGIVFLGAVVVEYVIVSNLLGGALGLAGYLVTGFIQLGALPYFVRDLRKDLKERKRSRNWYISFGSNAFIVALGTYNAVFWLVWEPYRELVSGVKAGGAIEFSYILLAPLGGVLIARGIVAAYRRQKAFKIVVTG